MLVFLRRQWPPAVFTIILTALIGLALYGHMNTKSLSEAMAGPSSHKIRLRSTPRQPGASNQAPFLDSLPRPPPRGGVPPSKEMLRYWKLLLRAMMDARPPTDQVVTVQDPVTDGDMQPDPDRDQTRVRIDKTHLPDSLRDALKGAHADFVRVAKSLGLQLPYAGKTFGARTGASEVEAQAEAARTNGFVTLTRPAATRPTAGSGAPADSGPSRGIVMTAGGSYVGIAVTSILMLRRSGSLLPVQLFLDSDGDYDAHLCETVLPALGTECHVMQRFWETTPAMPPLERFQFKVFSILLSSFQQVLFLDADCWPIHRPDALFDAAPFTTRGLVTWPDFWLSTTAPVLYDIVSENGRRVVPPRLAERRSSESGVLLYDKARHGTSLVLAAYYNFYGPAYYYPLLSQGAIGQGDKETFLHGAMVMGNPFYAVHTPIGILGRWINGTYIGAAMRQADPVEDYRLVEEGDADDSKRHARWLFVHHNLVKMDLCHLAHSMRSVYARNEHGRLARLWDVDTDADAAFVRDAGYDVERAMWDEVRAAVCSRRHGFFLASRECADLETYYRAVFEQE